MPFAKVIELRHDTGVQMYVLLPQPAVNLYLTDNTKGMENKPLTNAFPLVFIYLKCPAKDAGNGTPRP